MTEFGQVKVCFQDGPEGGPQQFFLAFVSNDGTVYYQSELYDVQSNWCVSFGPACAECDLQASANYEPATESKGAKGAGKPTTGQPRPAGGQAGKPGPHGK